MGNEDLDQQDNANADPLYGHLKTLMPEASDDDLQTHVDELRARAPGAPDDQLIQAASGAQQDAAQKQQVNSYIAQKYGLLDKYSPENRQALVDQNAQDSSGPNWLAGLGALGAGIAGRDSIGAGQAILNQQKAGRENKLNEFDKGKALAMEDQDYKQKQSQFAVAQDKAKREADPTSPESKLAQKIFTDMGGDPELAGRLTAAKFKELSPLMEKKYAVDERKLAATEHNSAIAANNAARQSVQDEKKDKQLADQQSKDVHDLSNYLGQGWAARSGNAGKVQDKINSAEAAEALIEQGRKQPGGLDSRQLEELAQSTSKMLGGGTQASARVDALVPHTWLGRAQSLKEFISNEPTGQQAQAFVERMAETVAREKELAQTQQKQHQVSGLASFDRLKKTNPDAYAQILSSHGLDPSMVDDKGQYRKPDKITNTADNGMVRVKDPKGNIRQIPKDQVKNALAAGGSLADIPNMATED